MPDCPRCVSGLEETTEHAFYYCRSGITSGSGLLASNQATRAARRWLHCRQRSSSVSGLEACGVSYNPSCSSNGDLDDANEGIL